MAQTDSDILNLARALNNVGGDWDLLREIAALFLDDSEERMREIRLSVSSRNAEGLLRSSHSLKGSVGNFGAEKVAAAAHRLEMRGKHQDWSGVEEDLSALEEEIARLRPVLQSL